MAEFRSRRPRGASGRNPTHSIRCTDEVWEKAKRRAEYEGMTISWVASSFIEGYAAGLVDAPKTVKQYSKPREPDNEVA